MLNAHGWQYQLTVKNSPSSISGTLCTSRPQVHEYLVSVYSCNLVDRGSSCCWRNSLPGTWYLVSRTAVGEALIPTPPPSAVAHCSFNNALCLVEASDHSIGETLSKYAGERRDRSRDFEPLKRVWFRGVGPGWAWADVQDTFVVIGWNMQGNMPS